MIACKLMFCAQQIVRDADTNAVSAFNIIDSMTAVSFPLFVPAIQVIALLERTGDDQNACDVFFRISLGETELVKQNMTIMFQDALRSRAKLVIQGIVIPNPGLLRVVLELAGVPDPIGSYEFTIDQLPQPKVEAKQVPTSS